jgi:carbon monoxide dehydrogenase subunit G
MIEKYESKQQQIRKPAEMIYAVLSDFNNFTPIVGDKVEGWTVEGDQCSFRVKGIAMTLRIVEKIPSQLVKIKASDSSPFGFTLWVQMKEAGRDTDGGFSAVPDTRIRLVLHAEMNMMIKMMVGGKIQPALDGIAEQIAKTFNAI